MEKKRCTRCDIEQPLDDEYFPKRKSNNEQGWRWDSWCRECYKANTHRIQTKNPDLKRQRDREWREKNSERYHAQARLRYQQQSKTQRERNKANARAHNNKLKREALERYGGAFCKCCGEVELVMLTLDHVDGNGASHRRSLTGSTRQMPQASYKWARQNNWPPIFQVLCLNCNWARHWNNGVCPHELQRQLLTLVTVGTARTDHAA